MSRNSQLVDYTMNRILIVEDDASIRDMLLYILQKEDYPVSAVGSAEAALAECERERPALILLDIQLPGINGYQLCERLKLTYGEAMPLIIMLTDRADVSDMEKGLASFADDYIAKPFNPRLLLARLTAILRRSSGTAPINKPETVSLFGVSLDPEARQVLVEHTPIQLQKMEFDILQLLMTHPNRVFSRDALISGCKGDNYFISDRAIDNQIYKLRKKLGKAGKHLTTVSGVGYRFSSQ